VTAPDARQEILDAMYWYPRAFDRLDKDVFAHCFHDDAQLHYPFIDGPWRDVIEVLWKSFLLYTGVSMQLSQVKIDLDPEDPAKATAESYATVHFWEAEDAEPEDYTMPGHDTPVPERIGTKITKGKLSVVCARYKDAWSQRDGRWAMDDRQAIVDFYISVPGEGWLGTGRRDRSDPTYELPGFS
jgi:hypothetical protein